MAYIYLASQGECIFIAHSGHVETCVLLSRRNIGNKSTRIEIEIDLDEADRRECIGRATYQEIKNYILEHYQTKVSSLYISQVKRKCGLETRENFNKPKTDGNKVPNCPLEKEEIIKEALKYFGMLNEE
ncbi:MAG: RNA methyltransferase [Lachnospiraceae bacterium]|nr:RNA methyltransferase [Lachnospiraceae bacterium]